MCNNWLKTKGFTLVELMIVIGITTILTGVSSVVYGNLQKSTQLNDISAQISQNLRLAREQSLAGLNDKSHGVKFNSNQYILYQGDNYTGRSVAYDRSFSVSSALTITADVSGQEVNFSRGTGLPSATGTITIAHSIGGAKSVIINSDGIILEQ